MPPRQNEERAEQTLRWVETCFNLPSSHSWMGYAKRGRYGGDAPRASKRKSKKTRTASTAMSGWTYAFLHRSPWISPLILFSISFFFRLYYMNEGLFHHDEIWIAQAVERLYARSELIGAVNGRYGSILLNAIFYAPYRAFTGAVAEKVISFTSILSGALLVVVVYYLVLEFIDNRVSAFLAALFLNFNFLFLTFSTIGKENIANALFAVLAILLILRGVKQNSIYLKVLGFASFAFSITVHEAGIALLPILLAFLTLFHLACRRPHKLLFLDFGLFLVLISVPFFLYLGKVFFRAATVRSTDTAFFEGLFTPIFAIAAKDLYQICWVPLLALAAAGAFQLKKNLKVLVPLCLWILLLFYYGNISCYCARYLLYIVIPIVIFAGIGAGVLLERFKSMNWKIMSGGIILLLVCGYGLFNAYPLISFRREYCGPKRMALHVQANTEPDALIITEDESVYITYYARREVMSHPDTDYALNRDFVEMIRDIALTGRKVYVNSSAFSYDAKAYFEKLMRKNFELVPAGQVLDEDYHRPELSFTKYQSFLFRLIPK
jgi:hypothetical protein